MGIMQQDSIVIYKGSTDFASEVVDRALVVIIKGSVFFIHKAMRDILFDILK